MSTNPQANKINNFYLMWNLKKMVQFVDNFFQISQYFSETIVKNLKFKKLPES